ncbi:MAG: ribosome small subunit-dependent GTPase A [Bulleidia sp.]|nr:ribosome small subunit-dependent GTPase A [Bulleidia sp.]
MKGTIIKILSKDYTLHMEDGQIVTAMTFKKARLAVRPVIGDEVECEVHDGKYGITSVLPRRNMLCRPACANIDQVLIVMSVKDPDFSAVLVDRLSFLIVHAGMEPVLCVTKCDLGINAETEARIREYEQGPMQVIRTGRDHLDPALAGILRDKVTVLTGQSGAGKSSLLNELDPSFHLATQEISKALGRGKHTTRHSELHAIAGGFVADTPGFSSLDFSRMSVQDLQDSVLEFRPYLGQCRFNDCVHQNEPGCAVKEAVEQGRIPRVRYENYLEILKQIQERKERYL